MSRSGYCESLNEWDLIRWRGAVASAIKGRRGQAFLHELAHVLDAMPTKELIAHELEKDGQFCALGVVGHMRGLDLSHIDPEEPEQVSHAFDIAQALSREIVFINDEAAFTRETPAGRWQRVRDWVAMNLKG
jgi:hypothetical protein